MDKLNENNIDLISIIIPVYNVEKYINKCLNSVFNQTYKNIEIIVVNDGSTDNCEKIILDNYKDEKRLIYIKKENGGLSSARNLGIEKSKGKYICFVDSDDWIEKDYIEKMYNMIIKDDSQICVCNMKYIFEDGKIKKRTPVIKEKEIVDNTTALNYLLEGKKYKFHAVNKMYQRSLFIDNNIRFELNKLYEDVFTTYKLFVCACKISLIPDFLYNYLQNRKGSILNTRFNEKRFDILEAISEVSYNKYINKNVSKKSLQCFYITNIISIFNYIYNLEKKERTVFYNRIVKDNSFKLSKCYFFNYKLSFTNRIRFFLIKNNFTSYVKLMKIIKG